MQRRAAGSDPAQRVDDVPEAHRLVEVLGGSEPDVISKPLRLLVRVGVTTDVHQQCGVVDRAAVVLAEPGLLAEAERDDALSEHVFHRLSEAEVDAEGEGGDELGEPNRRAVAPLHHRAERTSAALGKMR